MNKVVLTLLGMIFSILLHSQCTILQSGNASDIWLNGGVGQSFEASCTGLMESFTFRTGTLAGCSTFDFDLRDENCNVLWSVLNVPISANQEITVDLSLGSGSSTALTQGEMYSVHIITLPCNNQVRYIQQSSSGFTGNLMPNPLVCTSSSGGDLWLEIEIDGTVPVEYSKPLRITEKNSRINLSFSVVNQINNAYFEIQNMHPGSGFKKIGEIKGESFMLEEKSYEFEVTNIAYGHNSFVIKQVDINGAYSYSNTVSYFNDPDSHIQYNSFEQDLLVFNLVGQDLAIFDSNGNIAGTVRTEADYERFNMAHLPRGIYFVRSQQIVVFKFLKM